MNEELTDIRLEINFLEGKLNEFRSFKKDIKEITDKMQETEMMIMSKLNEVRIKYSMALTRHDIEFAHKNITTVSELPETVRGEWFDFKNEYMNNCHFTTDPEACRDCNADCYKYANEKINQKYSTNLN